MEVIKGDSILEMKRGVVVSEMLKQVEDISLDRMKREVQNSDCSGSLQSLKDGSHKCIKDAAVQYLSDMFVDQAYKKVRDIPQNYTKADYYARKTCNYLTAGMQDCYNCLPTHERAYERDHLVKQILNTMEGIPGFDADKCPVTKEYLRRNSSGFFGASAVLVVFSNLLLCFH